ncbi:unnamed protein product [Urochloa humidicola]
MANGVFSIRDVAALFKLITELLRALNDNRMWEAVAAFSGGLMILIVAIITNGPPLEGYFLWLIVLASIFAILGLHLGVRRRFNNNEQHRARADHQRSAGFIFLAIVSLLLALVMYAGGFEVRTIADIVQASLKLILQVFN